MCDLHVACQAGDVNAVAGHLDAGADINAQDALGATPLNAAALGGQYEISRLLLERGADHDIATHETRRTPLHTAALHAASEVCRALLEHGASVNARDVDGYTPLWWAIVGRDVETIGTLLDGGADVNETYVLGMTQYFAIAERRIAEAQRNYQPQLALV